MTVGQRTTFLKAADLDGAQAPKWFVIDADGMVVGRLATQIATVLMGKHKAAYTPHVDTGDYVIVVNADKVRFVGNPMIHEKYKYLSDKMAEKEYFSHSQFPGGLKRRTGIEVWEKNPTRILHLAVRRMLPKNALARHMLDKLKLYAGPDHPHQAQSPEAFPAHLLPSN